MRNTSRFPVLRKAFRQIRSDIRYQAGALRDTANYIRHDVEAALRGATPSPHDQSSGRYGYRGDTVYPRDREYYYGEPQAQRRATRRAPARTKVEQQEVRRGRETSAEPRIVAPRREPEPEPAPKTNRSPKHTPESPETAATANAKQTEPKVESKPKPKQPEGKPNSESEGKSGDDRAKSKPVEGKVEYPTAKRSSRPGFHYSPYEPYELLDTQGIEPGGLARDPGNGKIFRIPK